MTAHEYVDAGEAERIERRADELIAAAERTGSHVWITTVAYRCADPAAPGPFMLDRENLLIYPRVGCYRCEQPYTPRLAHRRCTGDPT